MYTPSLRITASIPSLNTSRATRNQQQPRRDRRPGRTQPASAETPLTICRLALLLLSSRTAEPSQHTLPVIPSVPKPPPLPTPPRTMSTTSAPPKKLSIPSTLASITKHWSPKLIGALNSNVDVKLAKLKGEFVWHSHANTDEMFYVVSGGPLVIQFEEADGGNVVLAKGEMLLIPRGVRHCPLATAETEVMLIEGVGVVNTGKVVDRSVLPTLRCSGMQADGLQLAAS